MVCRLETARTLRQQASRMSEDALACAQRLCKLKLFHGSHCAIKSATWMWFIHLGQLKLCSRIAQWQQDKWQTFAFQKHSKQHCIGGFFRLQTWSLEPTWSDTKSFRRTCEVFDSQFRIGFNMIYIELYWLMLKIDQIWSNDVQNSIQSVLSCLVPMQASLNPETQNYRAHINQERTRYIKRYPVNLYIMMSWYVTSFLGIASNHFFSWIYCNMHFSHGHVWKWIDVV